MYQDAFDALGKLGLKREEAKIYLACLRNRAGLFVHEITQISGVKRSTVDLIINRLLSRNFLSSFREGQRRKFMAESPERILFDYQREIEDFRNVIPMLMRLGTGAGKTRVTFFEGAKGIRAIYDDILLTARALPEKERIVCCFSSGRDVEKIQPRFRQQFIDRRIKDHLFVRMIAVRNDPNETWPSSARDLRVTKMFDGMKYPFNIEFSIIVDKIMIASAYKPAGAISIQNKVIADSLRSLFNLLWDLLGPPEPDLDAHYEDKSKKRISAKGAKKKTG